MKRGNDMKLERGITLIALIITIIIMLILAGVVLSLTLGENGLLKKAEQASVDYKIAEIKEKVEGEILNQDIEKLEKGEELTVEQALVGIEESGVFSEIDLEEESGICDGYKVQLGYNEIGKVVILGITKDVGTRIIITKNPKGYTNGKVEITIDVRTNNIGVKTIEVPEEIILKENNVYETNKNGTYKVRVILESGQELEKEIVINTIDTIPPKTFGITAETQEDSITITAQTQDSEATQESICSGISHYEYYINGEKKESNKITGLANGTYTVYVIAYDKAGNFIKSEEKQVEVLEWVKIYNEEDFRNISNDLSKNYMLMNDIQLTSVWKPVGDYSNKFTGILEENYHKIKGLQILESSTHDTIGLFRFIGTNGKIRNLNIEDAVLKDMASENRLWKWNTNGME